ncbi:MAG: hypothetical protein AAGI46_10615 [Planctomycetota bacterium]
MSRLLIRLTALAAVVLTLATGGIAIAIDQLSLWIATSALGLAMLLVSLGPTAWALTRIDDASADTLPGLASVIVVASLLKAGAAAGGVLVLVMLLEQPTWTTFSFVAGWYVVLTGVQVGVAGWAFWRRDGQRVESAAAGSSVTAPPP